MSILNLLGLVAGEAQSEAALSGSRAVREIIQQLRGMEPGQARYLAAFAYILSQVADADLEISETETRAMEELVMGFGHLSPEKAHLVVAIAKNQASLFGGTQNFVVTREFKEISTVAQRTELLHCLFAVSATDDLVSNIEEEVIRKIARELGFDHRGFVAVRSQYNDLREVMKDLPKGTAPGEEG